MSEFDQAAREAAKLAERLRERACHLDVDAMGRGNLEREAAAEIERLTDIIKYAIKQTYFGGCYGGLSESEARTVHDALVLKLSGKDVNHE